MLWLLGVFQSLPQQGVTFMLTLVDFRRIHQAALKGCACFSVVINPRRRDNIGHGFHYFIFFKVSV